MAWDVLVLLLVLVAPLTPPLPLALIQPASAQPQRAVVLSIGDGDTIRVRQGNRAFTLRLACIDAPETAQSPYGVAARRYLQQRLRIGQEVTIQPKTIDRYGRTVAEVISDININLVMVEDGQAYPLRGPAATSIAVTWPPVTPGNTWRPSSAPAATGMACGRWRGASPAPGIFAGVMAPRPAGRPWRTVDRRVIGAG